MTGWYLKTGHDPVLPRHFLVAIQDNHLHISFNVMYPLSI